MGVAAAQLEQNLDSLAADFPQFDRVLLQGMLEDQGGDVQEVHACLRVSACTQILL